MRKVGAWDSLDLDYRKMLAFCSGCGAAAGFAVLTTTRNVLPSDSALLGLLVSVVVFYLAWSLPGRVQGAAALAQSREAPALAVMGTATLEATHSRTKAILLLRSADRSISSLLTATKRSILLGHPADVALSRTERLASSSAYEVLRSISSPEHPAIAEEGEEAGAIVRASQLGEESKMPLFTAAAFFAPLMLILYAIIGHVADPLRLAEMVGLQIIILDVAFYFSSDVRRAP